MTSRISKTFLALASSILLAVPAASSAEGTLTIDNFESYSADVGAWAVVNVANIASVNLQLGLSGALDGNKDLRQILAVSLPGASFTVQNLSLNLDVPTNAEYFQYKMKSLVALNLGRTVTITLRDQDNVNHVSAPISLATLIISTEPTQISAKLADFSPPFSGGTGKKITGVSLKFDTTLAGVAGAEQIDSLEFTLGAGPASVSNWTVYN